MGHWKEGRRKGVEVRVRLKTKQLFMGSERQLQRQRQGGFS